MKYEFRLTEQQIRKFWVESYIYRFNIDNPGQVFAVDTPPPYVSATHLHAGHAMSYTQADIVVRYNRMIGRNVFYPIGFDDNGLPTERFVEKHNKIDRRAFSRKQFREMCLRVTQEQSRAYEQVLCKLGISVDWSQQYSTIDQRCQRISQLSFIDLYRKGLIVRKNEPIIWCCFCETALSQSDVEETEGSTFLFYISFEIRGEKAPVTIATTRPELLPACVALFVHPADERYKDLIGKEAVTPFFGNRIPILTDEKVDPNFGTGILMVCTWGDTEDIRMWKKYGLPTIEVVSSDGTLTSAAGRFEGMNIVEARKTVSDFLSEQGIVTAVSPIEHIVNVHERCGLPIEYRRSPQWFVKIVSFQDVWQQLGEQLDWFPPSMKTRYDDWVKGLKWDWCISRQRHYGVPFPVWHCADCAKVVLAQEAQLPIDPPEDMHLVQNCPDCGSVNIQPERDVMDTWMTSSLTPFITSHWKDSSHQYLAQKIYPMTIRVQGFEIIRTWLFYTIVKAFFHTASLPWSKVMISGWGLNEKGEKLSKSSGRSLDAMTIIEKYSADALRYWAASGSLGSNLRFSENQLRIGQKLVTKLWNCAHFLSSYQLDQVPKNIGKVHLHKSDKWILHHLNRTAEQYHSHFGSCEYSKALHELDRFFWKYLCDNYLEFVKHRLQANGDEPTRASALATTSHVIRAVVKMYAPFLPFITEVLYREHFAMLEGMLSVHVSSLPLGDSSFADDANARAFQTSVEVIALIRKYKSKRSMSMKAGIECLTIDAPDPNNLDLECISKVMSVRSIVLKSIEIPDCSADNIKILV